MCESAALIDPENLHFVSNHFKTQGIYEKALDNSPYMLRHVPDCCETQMCAKVVA